MKFCQQFYSANSDFIIDSDNSDSFDLPYRG
jgi:hypothetical protein